MVEIWEEIQLANLGQRIDQSGGNGETSKTEADQLEWKRAFRPSMPMAFHDWKLQAFYGISSLPFTEIPAGITAWAGASSDLEEALKASSFHGSSYQNGYRREDVLGQQKNWFRPAAP